MTAARRGFGDGKRISITRRDRRTNVGFRKVVALEQQRQISQLRQCVGENIAEIQRGGMQQAALSEGDECRVCGIDIGQVRRRDLEYGQPEQVIDEYHAALTSAGVCTTIFA